MLEGVMNPSLKLLLVILLSLELTFVTKLWINLIVIVMCLLILIHQRFHWRQFCWLAFVPLFPALAIFITIVFFSPSHSFFVGTALFSRLDRKSTRLNSSHVSISYAVFCLKKKSIG